MRKNYLSSLLLFLFILSFSAGLAHENINAASGNLGLVLDVLPSNDPEIAKLTVGQALWFVIPPGESKSRQVRISSSSTVPEVVNMSIGFLNRINGVASVDDSKKSETAEWASFSPQTFTLTPGGFKILNFTYQIPGDAEIGIHEAFLFATATSAGLSKNPGYRVPGAARIASPIFLGVGTSAQIDTDFSIDNVTGVVVDGVRNLKIDFKNTGKTPLNLSGNVQLSSTEFKDRLVGPLQFTSVVIRPGINGYVLIPTPNELTPGEWKILVTASQISNMKTREFIKVIDFKAPSTLIPNLIRILLVFFFLFLLNFSVRILRAPRKKKAKLSTDLRKPRVLKKSRNNAIENEEFEEVDRILEEITARIRNNTNKKSSLKVKKKTAIRKVTSKKVPAKKAVKGKPAKRTPVKKSATKSKLTQK